MTTEAEQELLRQEQDRQRQEQQRQQQEAAKQAAARAIAGRDVARDPWEVTIPSVPPPVEDRDVPPPPPPPIKTPAEKYPGEAPPPPPPRPPLEAAIGEGPPPPPIQPPKLPDKPGGQVATVNGQQKYIVGSTMREVYGFHTPQEYLEAQRAGVMYGVHKGSGAPEGSVLVKIRQGGKDVTVRYSGEKEGVSQSVYSGLEKEKYRIPYTIEGKTVFLTGSQADKITELSGKPQFDYLKNIGAIKPDRVYIPGKDGEWAYMDTQAVKEIRGYDIELYDELMSKGYDAYQEKFNSKYIIIGDQAMARDEWNKLDTKYQAIAREHNDFNAINDVIRKELSDSIVGAPIGAKEAYERGGIDAYNNWVNDYNNYIDKNFTELKDGQYISNIELEKIKQDTPLLYEDLKAKGYDATFGYMEKVKESNPRLYFGTLQKYGMVPEKAVYVGSTPDGTVQYIAAPEIKTEGLTKAQVAKEVGVETAAMLVPGVWMKDLNIGKENQMPAWMIGLNAGLDLLILVPVAGWAARAGGKAILKAGTSTITKSLAKELPKELAKAGEKALAAESKQLAKQLRPIDKLLVKVEKAATATAKAEKTGNIDKFVKAVSAENLAKSNYAQTLRKWGTDIAVFNSKLADTSIKGIGKQGLSKAVGLASKAEDFANYVAGTTKELVRANLAKSLPKKAGGAIARSAKAYAEIPKTIAEVSKATALTIKGGAKEGAAYLRGAKSLKLPKSAGPAMSQKEVNQRFATLQKAIDKEAAAGRARVAKYEGKAKTLAKWDGYIQEPWPPAGGGRWYPRQPLPAGGGGVATVNTIAVTSEQAAKYGPAFAQTYQVPIRTLAGTKVFTVIVNPQEGTTEIVRTPERVDLPQIIVVEDDKWPIIAPSESKLALPTVEPKPEVLPAPGKEPKIKIYYIEKPKALSIAEVKPLASVSPKTEAKLVAEIKTKVTTKVGTITETKPSTKAMPVAKVTPVTKARAVTKVKAATKIMPAVGALVTPRAAVAPKITPKPVIKPVTKPVTKIKTVTKPKPKILLLPEDDSSDKGKRERIKKSKGAVAWNMGKLGRKNPQDIWHVRMPDGEHIVLKGAPPKGARILADGPGSAYKTTQAIGGPLRRAIAQQHGAVKAIITPSRRGSGAEARFTPTGLKSIRKGRQFYTRMGGGVAISRRPLGRRRR